MLMVDGRYPSWQQFLADFIPTRAPYRIWFINDRILCPGCAVLVDPVSKETESERKKKKAIHFCHVNLIYISLFIRIYILCIF